jgi:hypothetical protein
VVRQEEGREMGYNFTLVAQGERHNYHIMYDFAEGFAIAFDNRGIRAILGKTGMQSAAMLAAGIVSLAEDYPGCATEMTRLLHAAVACPYGIWEED